MIVRKKLSFTTPSKNPLTIEDTSSTVNVSDIEDTTGEVEDTHVSDTTGASTEIVETISVENNLLSDTSIQAQMYNLISPGNGYLSDIYKVECENINWLTGWEIAKIIFDKNYTDECNLTLYGYFSNINKDFASGYLYYILSLNKNNLKHKYYIYSEESICDIKDVISNHKCLHINNMEIDYIDTIDYEETKYGSSNACRYIYNYLRRYVLYLNFAVIDNENTNINNAMHTILNINKDFGVLFISIPWFLKTDSEIDDASEMSEDRLSDSVIIYVYLLSCIFSEIQLLWFPWDNKVWILCSKKKNSFTKKIWIDILNSNYYSMGTIVKEELEKELILFYKEIMTKKNELNDNANEENIIQKWIETNDNFLEQLIENN